MSTADLWILVVLATTPGGHTLQATAFHDWQACEVARRHTATQYRNANGQGLDVAHAAACVKSTKVVKNAFRDGARVRKDMQ